MAGPVIEQEVVIEARIPLAAGSPTPWSATARSVPAGDDVFHTYSAYSRGFDGLWTMWQWLDRAPLGRSEGDVSWFHRHDEYPATAGEPS